MTAKKMPKNAEIFYCKICDFQCSKQSNYEKHLLTRKHKNTAKILPNTAKKMPKNAASFMCSCGKEYKHRQSLTTHKKKCQNDDNSIVTQKENYLFDKDELIKYLIKENIEFKEMIIEQNKMVMKICEKDCSTISNSNINSNNKTFNLQFFLNETCKDAMNIMDFVDSIQLQLSDLEKVGEIGFVEGISNIIVKNLKQLDITQRPVHCTDKKRETLYIKDENKWEKEDIENNKMRKVIKKVANKNIRMLQKFKEMHPDCGKSCSKYSDQYDKIIVESMGGPGDNDLEKEDKIIKKITKEVIINKDGN
jgi:hypothetical protein